MFNSKAWADKSKGRFIWYTGICGFIVIAELAFHVSNLNWGTSRTMDKVMCVLDVVAWVLIMFPIRDYVGERP